MKLFDLVEITKPKKNKFDLSHERKQTMNMGDLTPILVQEVIPGDSWRGSTELLIRFQPLQAPVYARMNARIDYFFVPNRLVWNQWEEFITGGEDGTAAPVPPHMNVNSTNKVWLDPKTLADYMGIPTPATIADSTNINLMALRAYQLIYDEWYRDQDLVPKVGCSKAGGNFANDAAELTKTFTMRKRAWEKDYFTSARPWAQKGGTVILPNTAIPKYPAIAETGPGLPAPPGAMSSVAGGGVTVAGNPVGLDTLEGVDITINDFRKASRLQRWLERNARAGSRYIEFILAQFGQKSSDARLQRPEYLGGGKSPVVISEVLSAFQQADDAGYPQGTMTGHGIGVGNQNQFKFHAEEHGYIIGIMSVLPRTTYQQGIPKHFLKLDKFDYAFPEFGNLGEQEIDPKELFWDGSLPPNATFGYIPRYTEYKYSPSTVHADFKTTLAYWQAGRIFTTHPILNESFISADPTTRIFAVEDPDQHHLLVQLYHNLSAVRPLPYFGTPTL